MNIELPGAPVTRKKRGCLFWLGMAGIAYLVLSVLTVIFLGFAAPHDGGKADGKTAEAQAITSTPTSEASAAPPAPAALPAPAATPLPEPIEVTARELYQAYAANEAAAKELFDDRPIMVRGVVAGVTLDIFDEPVVQLRSGNSQATVVMDLDSKDNAAAAKLRVGREMRALCSELTELNGRPLLDSCTLQ